MKKLFPLILFLFICIAFFQPFFLKKLLPIPSDTIIGLYNPFRDAYSSNYPNGIPFKNFLITDPVRQEYPWRFLSIALEKKGELPLWNPYNGTGTPLLANHQSAPFYPLNILFFVLPFATSWSVLIFLTPVLGGIFLYLYLRVLSVSKTGSFFGALIFSFCGFNISWLEWNTVGQTLLWLPLILLSIEKLFALNTYKKTIWMVLLIVALASSFFAGHLQTFSYVGVVTVLYFLGKVLLSSKKLLFLTRGGFVLLFTGVLILVQFIPILQFISLSARDVDVVPWVTPGWFLPWQHLAQFLSPDFFGNPTTLNYFGVWNYAELVGYIGIFPLLMVFLGVLVKRKVVWFFIAVVAIAFLFALPTPVGILPFTFHIPFLSTAQPTRLLSLIDFSFAVLAAMGLDSLIKEKSIKPILVIAFGIILFGFLWFFLLFLKNHILTPENISIAKRNSIIPTVFFILSGLSLLIFSLIKLPKKVQKGIIVALLFMTIFDLFRFSEKFTPFTNKEYLFPKTSTLSFLQKNIGVDRIMTTDSRLLPPNFSIMYSLPSVDIYDPLYIRRYAEFIAAMERNTPNITPPFGFNRIITPHNYQSPLINVLGVKYILSLSPLVSPNVKKVFSEGQTQIYENTDILPKSFFVDNILSASSKQDAIQKVFTNENSLNKTAIVERLGKQTAYRVGNVTIDKYAPNTVTLSTSNTSNGFLVMTDLYYPTWHAYIDGKETKIFVTDYIFRGIEVPKGSHTIVFIDKLF